MAFKKGDVVVGVDAPINNHKNWFAKGEKVTVTRINGDMIDICNSHGIFSGAWRAERFQPYRTFNKGDRVVVIKPFGERLQREKVYTVIGVNGGKSGESIQVEGDAGWWKPTRFQPAPAALPPEQWKVGDKVKVVGEDRYTSDKMRADVAANPNREYEILSIVPKGYGDKMNIYIQFPGWDAHHYFYFPSSLSHESEWGGVKKEEVPPPPKPPLAELLYKAVKNKPGSRCAFAMRNTDGVDVIKTYQACHAALAYAIHGTVTELINSAYNDMFLAGTLAEGGDAEKRKKHLDYYHYLLNESPWKDCYLTKDVSNVEVTGIALDVNQTSNKIAAACVALRESWEWGEVLNTFAYFKKKGFSGNVAYMLSRAIIVREGGEKPTFTTAHFDNSHGVLSVYCNWSELVRFFHSGYFQDTKKGPFSKYRDYTITQNIAKLDHHNHNTFAEFRNANLKEEVVGEGFHAQHVITEKSVLEFAALIEKQFKEGKV